MRGPAVVVDRMSKKFRRGERLDSLRDVIPAIGRRFLSGPKSDDLDAREFWAVRDLSFDVQPGEAVGIIGPNGAGKSTVLKLLTRILKPTRGTCVVRGRAGALIEVAAGFHPDLTGRENIYLQGAIMGMARQEIARKLDAIVDFAGTTEFLETPIKRYSSGMNARLGFAIAAHLDPQVLLIDEALAVGDLAFQQRCYERMSAFKRNGVAIVFVSHNLSAVAGLCDRVVVLVGGRLETLAPPEAAFEAYAALTSRPPDLENSPGGTIAVLDACGAPVTRVNAGDDIVVRALIQAPETRGSLAAGIRIRRVETGDWVYVTTSSSVGCALLAVQAPTILEINWRLTANLARGHYHVEIILFEAAHRNVLASLTAPQLTVHEQESEIATAFLQARCSVEPFAQGQPAGRPRLRSVG